MINLPPLHSSKRIDVKIIPEVLKTWQVGKILPSRARTSSNAEGELLIQIGSHLFDARTKSPILAGEDLQLQIARLGAEPLLKILTPATMIDPVTILLRQAVPQPDAMQTLFNRIPEILPLLKPVDAPVIKDIKQLVRQLEQLLTIPAKQETLDAGRIQQFLRDSGFNLEHQVSQGVIPRHNLKLLLIQLHKTIETLVRQSAVTIDNNIDISKLDLPEATSQLISSNRLPVLAGLLFTNLTADEQAMLITAALNKSQPVELLPLKIQGLTQALKSLNTAQVKQLQQWLQLLPMIGEIRHLAEHSLSTITHNQLQSLQADADSAFIIFFNLLVAKTPDWIDLFNIKISKESREQEEGEHWHVTIQMQLPELGKMEARLILADQQLHAGITSESKTTYQLVSQHLSLLEVALNSAGFNVATISSKHEDIKPIDPVNRNHGPLLDDKA